MKTTINKIKDELIKRKMEIITNEEYLENNKLIELLQNIEKITEENQRKIDELFEQYQKDK